MTSLLRPLLAAAATLAAAVLVPAAVTLSSPRAANLAPTGFTAVWSVSADEGRPGLDLYADPAGATSLAGTFTADFFPIALGDPAIVNDAALRAERRTLQDLVAGRLLVVARIGGLPAGATVYFRPRAYTDGGGENATNILPLTPVVLGAETRFITDARLLEIDFAGFDARGMVALLQGPEGTTPLAAVVGDAAAAESAVFSLAAILAAATGTNADFTGPVEFLVSLIGAGATGDQLTHVVTFAPDSFVASAETVAFAPTGGGLLAFAIDPVAGQDAGLAFTVTVRALRAGGEVLGTYAGSATLALGAGDAGALGLGGGPTPPFVNGVLADYPVRIDRGGDYVLTIGGSGKTGSSNAFRVSETFGSWRNADGSGTAQGGPADDPGTTGYANLQRYAFGMGGDASDRGGFPAFGAVLDGSDVYLSVTFERQPYASDLLYLVEATGDLLKGPWEEIARHGGGTPTTVTETDVVPVGPDTPRYLRVRLIGQGTLAGYLNETASAAARSDPLLVSSSADPYDAGIPNLLRFAFGLDHRYPNPAGLPAVRVVRKGYDHYMAVSFRRLPEAPGLQYIVERTTNYQTYTTVQVVLPGTPADVFIEDPLAVAGLAALRVRVVYTPPGGP